MMPQQINDLIDAKGNFNIPLARTYLIIIKKKRFLSYINIAKELNLSLSTAFRLITDTKLKTISINTTKKLITYFERNINLIS